ncbi:MAG: hypothetical protein FJ117_00185 [Deltaproteobacteria bacterium]|nr:hypothetical protein [Deltaproteobacteria bacterium]
MIIHLEKKDIKEVRAEGLFLPVDGSICKLGAAAGTALKQSLRPKKIKIIRMDIIAAMVFGDSQYNN